MFEYDDSPLISETESNKVSAPSIYIGSIFGGLSGIFRGIPLFLAFQYNSFQDILHCSYAYFVSLTASNIFVYYFPIGFLFNKVEKYNTRILWLSLASTCVFLLCVIFSIEDKIIFFIFSILFNLFGNIYDYSIENTIIVRTPISKMIVTDIINLFHTLNIGITFQIFDFSMYVLKKQDDDVRFVHSLQLLCGLCGIILLLFGSISIFITSKYNLPPPQTFLPDPLEKYFTNRYFYLCIFTIFLSSIQGYFYIAGSQFIFDKLFPNSKTYFSYWSFLFGGSGFLMLFLTNTLGSFFESCFKCGKYHAHACLYILISIFPLLSAVSLWANASSEIVSLSLALLGIPFYFGSIETTILIVDLFSLNGTAIPMIIGFFFRSVAALVIPAFGAIPASGYSWTLLSFAIAQIIVGILWFTKRESKHLTNLEQIEVIFGNKK